MIRNLLRFVGWRHVWRRPARTALTIVGVAVGVALFVAIGAINQSTLDFFRTNVGSMTGKATFTILGPEGGFAEDTVEVGVQTSQAWDNRVACAVLGIEEDRMGRAWARAAVRKGVAGAEAGAQVESQQRFAQARVAIED